MSEQELELKFRKIIEESEQNLRKEWHMQLSSQEEFNHRLDSEMNKIRTKLSRVAAQAAHDHRTIDIAAKIFDSIHITPFNKDKKVMKFSIDTVIGYSENLFDSISSWNYEIKDYDEPDNFNQNPVESHDYSFIISIDKY